jgi:CO dehydrogenase maturation factor
LKVFAGRDTMLSRGQDIMKIAVSGKGGVGKTTFAALLIKTLCEKGKRVLAIDADPDANLAVALGMPRPESIVPISEMKDLIQERTGAELGSVGAYFKLNPKVDDLPETCSVEVDGIKFMRLGGVKKGGGGCICPSSTLLRVLVSHILLARDEAVVMDMEAGIEHLARGTASAVDKLVVVVEPGRRSVETAHHIKKLAGEIGLKRVFLLGNKIRNQEDRAFLEEYVTGFEWLGFLPYDDEIIKCDLKGRSPYDADTPAKAIVADMVAKLIFEEPQKEHAHTHEHAHAHTHQHCHGDTVHAHVHSHVHTHGHMHSPDHGHAEDEHSHGHEEDHGSHEHGHDDTDSRG